MKRVCLLCIMMLMCCLECHAQECAEKVAFAPVLDESYSDDCSKIWSAMKESCSYVFFCRNGEVRQEKGYSVYRKDNLWHFQWGKRSFDDEEMKKFFDCTMYNKAVSKYVSKISEVKELIYDCRPDRVFALTEGNVYVITGYGEVWNNSVDDVEVCSIITWDEMYSQNVPMRLYVNNILIDDIAYVGKYGSAMPLRTILEAMGKEVKWQEEKREVIINNYICLKLDNVNKTFTASYTDNGHQIQLADWTTWSSYNILDDRMYIYDNTVSYLIQHWNYDISLNIPKREIRITDNNMGKVKE